MFEEEHPELHENVLKTLQYNGHWSHPESILLAMTHDAREEVREKAINIIQNIRNEEAAGVRKYQADIRRFEPPPNINFSAESYEELIDFDTVGIEFTSPPILNDYSIEEIRNQSFTPGFNSTPCHSQNVERMVALTSIAAANAVGQDCRHGYLLNKIQSTEKIGTHATKSEYVAAAASAKRKIFDDDDEKVKKK